MGSLLGESGKVWSTNKGGYVWNPIECEIESTRNPHRHLLARV